jgi:hypothetical protein
MQCNCLLSLGLHFQEGTAKTVEFKKKTSLTRKGTHQRQPENVSFSIDYKLPWCEPELPENY